MMTQTSFGARLLLTLVLAASAARAAADPAEALRSNFQRPPASARPWVLWFWNNGAITREGITADLEAMRRVGIGGVILMNVTRLPGPTTGPAAFMSDDWRTLVTFTIQEAHRLGIEVNLTNGPGWTGSSGPWITPELSMKRLVHTRSVVAGGAAVDVGLPKPFSRAHEHTPPELAKVAEAFYRDVRVLAVPGVRPATTRPAGAAVKRTDLIDLTDQTDADGRLRWDAPPGDWTVLRIGYGSTGKSTRPIVVGGFGLECDKLDAAGPDAMVAGLLDKIRADVGDTAPGTLVGIHIDSYEAGSQDWTANLPAEFRARRGYDLLPFLPAITAGVPIDDSDTTRRVKWDFEQTLAELLSEKYIGRMQTLARQRGLRLTLEGYRLPFGDEAMYAAHADEPMGEFWTPGKIGQWTNLKTTREMASVAHTNGRPVVGAEAFTSDGSDRWTRHPGTVKALGDEMLALGINRFVFHRYQHQHTLARGPGSTMGPYGLHYERTNTWWDFTGPWHEYLTRCQWMLRQGRYVADVLYLRPQLFSKDNFVPEPAVPAGYDFDTIAATTLLKRAAVKDGRIVLPDGMSYRLLVLPKDRVMTVELATKVKELIDAGATVLGPPPERTPGLGDSPRGDAKLAEIAAAVWGDTGNATATSRPVTSGRVFTESTIVDALQAVGVAPDFTSDVPLKWIHRATPEADIYFVANPSNAAVKAACVIRGNARSPEQWNPLTGQCHDLPAYSIDGGSTRLTLALEPAGSTFIVLRKPIDATRRIVSALPDGVNDTVTETTAGGPVRLQFADGKTRTIDAGRLPAPLGLAGPWTLHFPPNIGAPRAVTFDALQSLADHKTPGIKYFSGTVRYETDFTVDAAAFTGRRAWIDLGDVQVAARVKLNDQDLGVAWRPPYRIDATDALRPGRNRLSVEVATLWPNRMIGDKTLKTTPPIAATTWNPFRPNAKLLPAGLIGPVRVTFAAPLTWQAAGD